MCGIVGVTCLQGKLSSPAKIIRKCLEKLEYRGYDSVGLASIFKGMIVVRKGKGKIEEVHRRMNFDGVPGNTVIGHTRWATHGAPSDNNAHPHIDCGRIVAIVHNGIIKNYMELKKKLIAKGHIFRSETDTEVVAHLIEEYLDKGFKPYEAFKKAISHVKGSYAIAAIIISEPNTIFFAKKDSPLIIGIGDGFNFIASDIPAFLEHTRRIVVVKDFEVGYITPTNVFIENLHTGKIVDVSKRLRFISWTAEMAAKAGYPHYMLKEIHEQPRALRETINGLGEEIEQAANMIVNARRVFITAAGTSFHAGLVLDYYLNSIAGIATIPLIASEYSKYVRSVKYGDLLIAISQSGETIDTLMAVREFKKRGAKILAISNVIDSAIPRESDLTVYTRAGPEIGVAATKTFTTQVLVELAVVLKVAELNAALNMDEIASLRKQLEKTPKIVEKTIMKHEAFVNSIAEIIHRKNSMYYLGRGLGVPIAMEGALKLKEIAYIHAEAYPAGESKHGPIALVEKDFPVLFIVLDDENSENILGNVTEMKARNALTIGLIPEPFEEFKEVLDYSIKIPLHDHLFSPITYTPILQLLAYYSAVKRGYDPDKPRNLAKTVTVE